MAADATYKPAVTNGSLLLIAGMVWICVGAMLLILAFTWLAKAGSVHPFLFVGPGVVAALLIHHFGFLRIVDRNLKRILSTEEKKCMFGFVPWRSYLMIAVMMAMGALLRHSRIPKQYLAVLYIAIGLALVLSSVRYLRVCLGEMRRSAKG